MREIVFDTETTGFEPADGHRIVEIGCVELVDHFPTGNSFQAYLNPEREVPMESQRVHGLSNEFLADKPFFAAVAEAFLEFIGDAPLVIHNASFDIKFINAELARTGHPPIQLSRAIDTIEIAKRKIPGARYSLDELCKRFGIDLTQRSKHGALLDAELTAQLYLELIGGRQRGLALAPVEIAVAGIEVEIARAHQRPNRLEPRISQDEIALHLVFVEKELGPDALWNQA
jgi:DNA polymerase-3 subunit epsilon